MFTHVVVGSNDLAKSKAFYDAIFTAIGGNPGMDMGTRLAYAHKGSNFMVSTPINGEPATFANTIGAPFLAAHWRDPDFDPQERAFYYVRVLEIPTPRWTTYDAVRFGVKPPSEVPATVQDRAYTSAIWFSPGE